MKRAKAELALFVAITTIPARLPRVSQTILSLAAQSRPPQKILLSAPMQFRRFPNASMNLSLVKAQLGKSVKGVAAAALLETHVCDQDYGPGTKLLCVMDRLDELSQQLQQLGTSSVAVLADDDREYKPTALQLLEKALLRPGLPSSAIAYSFTTYMLPGTSISIGQGADIFALPLGDLGTRAAALSFFELCLSVDERFYFHDDVWISLYLAHVRGVPVCDIVSSLPASEKVPLTSSLFHVLWARWKHCCARIMPEWRLSDGRVPQDRTSPDSTFWIPFGWTTAGSP